MVFCSFTDLAGKGLSRMRQAVLACAVCLPLAAQAQTVDPGRAAFATGDFERALEIWTELAEEGDLHAQFNVGLLHDEGLGTAPDRDEARRWWRMAADQGLSEADHALALLEIELAGDGSGSGDLETALFHLNRAADSGLVKARFTLGKMYEYGLGVDADPETAVEHIRSAAESGFAKAQYNMGKRYRDGDGVEPDEVKSTEWFRRAALQGHPGGLEHLARRIHLGESIKPDPVGAMTYAILAVRAGHPEARDLATELKGPLSIEQLDRAFTAANAFTPEVVTGPVE
ncbi:tetratricopeptide repeat protein [Minwuia sp.]|uniref:tetratricopeptide repeat protein n=1 Tax=Minwuia sp. TaxID=2493630 RepID=UPI003A8F7142